MTEVVVSAKQMHNGGARRCPGKLGKVLSGACLYLVLSGLLMLLLTRSSCLYPYNNWDDANSYLSMGKSMFHGAVIYRDLFDQKGPYLYFLYGLASLISHTDFTGVFVMEVILGAFDLWLIRRILNLYCRKRTSLLLTPILFACICASKSFYWGGSAEEICLPFLLYPLFLLLRTLEEGNRAAGTFAGGIGQDAGEDRKGNGKTKEELHFHSRDVFAAGLCCGVVFCIKFTLMGFYLAFAIVVILTCRSRREFLHLAGCYALGILLPFVPWVVYFAIHGALEDWYRVYIYTNVFVYSNFGENSHGETIGQRVYDLAKILYWLILDNYQYYVFILIGMGWMLLRKSGWISRIAPILLFGLTFFFIYVGGATLPYYAIPLTVLSTCGMAAMGVLADRAADRMAHRKPGAVSSGQPEGKTDSREDSGQEKIVSGRDPGQGKTDPGGGSIQDKMDSGTGPAWREAALMEENAFVKGMQGKAATGVLLAAAAAFSLLICYHYSWNTYYLSYSREDVFLSRFTEDIEADREAGLVDAENTTLLNIGCLDCGLYTYADIYPTCYWFQTQTLPGDEVTNEQLSYITGAVVDYVVARDTYPEAIYDHYELIDSYHQVMGTSEFDYYLFRKANG